MICRLFQEVVAPCLPWRSGGPAAAVRGAAVAALSAALKRDLVTPPGALRRAIWLRVSAFPTTTLCADVWTAPEWKRRCW